MKNKERYEQLTIERDCKEWIGIEYETKLYQSWCAQESKDNVGDGMGKIWYFDGLTKVRHLLERRFYNGGGECVELARKYLDKMVSILVWQTKDIYRGLICGQKLRPFFKTIIKEVEWAEEKERYFANMRRSGSKDG